MENTLTIEQQDEVAILQLKIIELEDSIQKLKEQKNALSAQQADELIEIKNNLLKQHQQILEERQELLEMKEKNIEVAKLHETNRLIRDLLFIAAVNSRRIPTSTLEKTFNIPFTEDYVIVSGYYFKKIVFNSAYYEILENLENK